MKNSRAILMVLLACMANLLFTSVALAQQPNNPFADEPPPTVGGGTTPPGTGQPTTPPKGPGGGGVKSGAPADEEKIKKMIEEAISANQKKADEEKEKAVTEATEANRTWNKWLPMSERAIYLAVILGILLWNRRRLDRLSGIFRKYRPWLMQHDERLRRVEEQKALPSPAPPRS